VEIATFATGTPVLVISWGVLVISLATEGLTSVDPSEFVIFVFIALLASAVASIAFMSGALLGNALRRVGFLGTPKELSQGEKGDQEEAGWTIRQQVLWGFAGSTVGALISAVATVVAAAYFNQ
jgi:hypothetical protein